MISKEVAEQFIKDGILEMMPDVESLSVYCSDVIEVTIIYNIHGNVKSTSCEVQEDISELELGDLQDVLTQVVDSLRFRIEIDILKSRNIDIRDYESVKGNICYSLSKDLDHYADVVHLPYLDMTVYFYIFIDVESEYISRIEITYETLKFWKVSLQDLLQVAVFNMERLLPYTFDRIENEILDDAPKKRDIYLLSNMLEIHGACAILYPDVLGTIAEQLDSDLYIIIPSVHEAMITKENTYTENKQLEGLSEIVKRIYAIVDDMEKLSDRIYIYERANGKIRLLI